MRSMSYCGGKRVTMANHSKLSQADHEKIERIAKAHGYKINAAAGDEIRLALGMYVSDRHLRTLAKRLSPAGRRHYAERRDKIEGAGDADFAAKSRTLD